MKHPPPHSRGRNDPSRIDGEETFEQVFQQCESGLRAFLTSRLAQSSDVDDCLQAVCVKMLRHGDTVALATRQAWLFRVAANEATLVWRKRSRADAVMADASQDGREIGEAVDAAPDQSIINTETVRIATDLINQLSPIDQRIIHLRIHQDLPFRQIADELRLPLGTVLSKMNRAMRRIREQMTDHE